MLLLVNIWYCGILLMDFWLGTQNSSVILLKLQSVMSGFGVHMNEKSPE